LTITFAIIGASLTVGLAVAIFAGLLVLVLSTAQIGNAATVDFAI
jgi:hypothetical protein